MIDMSFIWIILLLLVSIVYLIVLAETLLVVGGNAQRGWMYFILIFSGVGVIIYWFVQLLNGNRKRRGRK